MVAFVLIDVTPEAAFTYQHPELAWVKQRFPRVVTLDVDARSEPMLVTHAQRLLQESRFCLLFVKSAPKQPLGAARPLLETLMGKQEGAGICLIGDQPQISAIVQARPNLAFYQTNHSPPDSEPFLASFLENSLKTEEEEN